MSIGQDICRFDIFEMMAFQFRLTYLVYILLC
jgi:hypothetical protein